MRLTTVALKVHKLTYTKLADLAETVIAGLTTMAGTYVAPPVTLLDMGTALTNLRNAISAWGSVGNRGSHADLLNLISERDNMRLILFQQALYAETVTPGNRTALGNVGWELRKIPRRSVGVLQQVQNLRQFTSRRIDTGTLKIRWNKPLDSEDIQINGYHVRRGATSDYDQSVLLDTVTRTSYLDMNPGTGYQFYWVVPFNASGPGVKSDPVMAIATPNP